MTSSVRPGWSSPAFVVPPELEATEPLERRGGQRDGTRLLVVSEEQLSHRRFRDLPSLLHAGDLVVVNTSATLPAALQAGTHDGARRTVHVSSPLANGDWVVEVRRTDNRGPELALNVGETLQLPAGVGLTLVERYPVASAPTSRMWHAVLSPPVALVPYLMVHGRPIRYGHQRDALPLSDYQNVYAAEPGSAEMASAGRPFTNDLLVRLGLEGVSVAGVVLHAGVSSPELHEPPYPERYQVSEMTAQSINATRRAGHRVVAVGTTVVRAVETACAEEGSVRAGQGWTSLVLGEQRPARVVSGLITGLHLPESSHLRLLEAVAGPALVRRAYAAALRDGYLWHEFGDSMLFLPESGRNA